MSRLVATLARKLVANLVNIRTGSTVHWRLAFITTGDYAGLRAQQGNEYVQDRITESSVKVDREWAWNGEGQAGLGIWSSENRIKGQS